VGQDIISRESIVIEKVFNVVIVDEIQSELSETPRVGSKSSTESDEVGRGF
jgi:hypothetical protein